MHVNVIDGRAMVGSCDAFVMVLMLWPLSVSAMFGTPCDDGSADVCARPQIIKRTGGRVARPIRTIPR